jgi:hypothetical protein
MNWMPLIQLALSVLAVFALGWLARWLQLGGDFRIKDFDHAKQLGFDAVYGFEAVTVAIDRAGGSALLKDAENQHMLLAIKGNKIIARIVTPDMAGRLDKQFLTINVGEPDFPAVTLHLGDKAQYWASGFRYMPGGIASNG